MGPGPCNPYPEAVEALGLPMLGHLDPVFVGAHHIARVFVVVLGMPLAIRYFAAKNGKDDGITR